MELLLIHQNYPGQFRYLATALRQRGHHVLGLGASAPARASAAGEQRLQLHYGWDPPPLPGDLVDPAVETALRRAQRVADRCLSLRNDGYSPDAILVHSGWGEALYLREVWPEARLLVYPELYASPGCWATALTPTSARLRWRSAPSGAAET